MRTFMGRNIPSVRLMITGSKAIPSSPPKSLLVRKEEGDVPAIISLKRDGEGVWQGVRDITIKPVQK